MSDPATLPQAIKRQQDTTQKRNKTMLLDVEKIKKVKQQAAF